MPRPVDAHLTPVLEALELVADAGPFRAYCAERDLEVKHSSAEWLRESLVTLVAALRAVKGLRPTTIRDIADLCAGFSGSDRLTQMTQEGKDSSAKAGL